MRAPPGEFLVTTHPSTTNGGSRKRINTWVESPMRVANRGRKTRFSSAIATMVAATIASQRAIQKTSTRSTTMITRANAAISAFLMVATMRSLYREHQCQRMSHTGVCIQMFGFDTA